MVINFKEISWDKLNNISYLDFGYKLGISDKTYVGTDMKCVYPHISKLYDCGLHVFVKTGQHLRTGMTIRPQTAQCQSMLCSTNAYIIYF